MGTSVGRRVSLLMGIGDGLEELDNDVGLWVRVSEGLVVGKPAEEIIRVISE